MIEIKLEYDSYRDEAFVHAIDTNALMGNPDKRVGQVKVAQNWLWSLEVTPKHRKQGIGQKIVERALQYIKERKYPHAYLYCKEDVRDWYRKRGWKQIETSNYAGKGTTFIMAYKCHRSRARIF